MIEKEITGRETIQDCCPGALMYTEVIKWGLEKADTKNVVMKYGQYSYFRFTPELRDVLRTEEDILHLQDIISAGFRTFTNVLPKKGEQSLFVYTGANYSEVLTLDIQQLIDIMDGENRPDMKGRIYTDPETYSGFIIPSTLEESIEYGKSNAKFIADVIVAGFEVYDIENDIIQ